MWEDILNIVISNGIFATLFVGLLLYLLKDSSKRENKYTDTINSLNENLNTALDIGEKVDEVKTGVLDIKEELGENSQEIGKVSSIAKDIGGKLKETNLSLNSLDESLKTHTKMIKKVSADVKVVKKDVKEIKKHVFPKEEESK